MSRFPADEDKAILPQRAGSTGHLENVGLVCAELHLRKWSPLMSGKTHNRVILIALMLAGAFAAPAAFAQEEAATWSKVAPLPIARIGHHS